MHGLNRLKQWKTLLGGHREPDPGWSTGVAGRGRYADSWASAHSSQHEVTVRARWRYVPLCHKAGAAGVHPQPGPLAEMHPAALPPSECASDGGRTGGRPASPLVRGCGRCRPLWPPRGGASVHGVWALMLGRCCRRRCPSQVHGPAAGSHGIQPPAAPGSSFGRGEIMPPAGPATARCAALLVACHAFRQGGERGAAGL